jgi:hypothetical protein
LTPGSGKGKKSGSGIRIRDEQPGSYFLELTNHCFGLKYLNSLMRIRDGNKLGSGIRDPRWKKVGSGINIPDPQQCMVGCPTHKLHSLLILLGNNHLYTEK